MALVQRVTRSLTQRMAAPALLLIPHETLQLMLDPLILPHLAMVSMSCRDLRAVCNRSLKWERALDQLSRTNGCHRSSHDESMDELLKTHLQDKPALYERISASRAEFNRRFLTWTS